MVPDKYCAKHNHWFLYLCLFCSGHKERYLIDQYEVYTDEFQEDWIIAAPPIPEDIAANYSWDDTYSFIESLAIKK